MKQLLALLLLWVMAVGVCPASDTLQVNEVKADTTVKRASLVTRFLNYFNDANKNKHNRRFDFSVIGGPHYSTDTKFGIGLTAAGLYRTNPNDSLLPPSNVALYGDFSSVGFYLLGIRGTHIMPSDRYRLDYTTYFFSFPSKFWGMGYTQGDNDDNESDLRRWQANIKVAFLIRLAPHFYGGPLATFDFVSARRVENEALLEQQPHNLRSLGLGLTLAYDTRDVLTQPHRGVYLKVSQTFRPRPFAGDYCFSSTDWQANGYVRPWSSAVLAGDFRGTLNYGHPAWGMMAKLGSGSSMRGYYEGRYRDRNCMEAQIELRQHVWKRNGLVVWAGAGTVWGREKLMMRHMLPNYGLGYRWEFKRNVNVRLDYGFGKGGQKGFLFNINEAF